MILTRKTFLRTGSGVLGTWSVAKWEWCCGSTDLLVKDRATGFTFYFWTYISCVHCTSVCQSSAIQRWMKSLTFLDSFLSCLPNGYSILLASIHWKGVILFVRINCSLTISDQSLVDNLERGKIFRACGNKGTMKVCLSFCWQWHHFSFFSLWSKQGICDLLRRNSTPLHERSDSNRGNRFEPHFEVKSRYLFPRIRRWPLKIKGKVPVHSSKKLVLSKQRQTRRKKTLIGPNVHN